jgi:thymidylate synthase (FAD)
MEVDLIDHMGSDLTVANSARVSFDKHKDELDDADVKLIRYLANHDHWTPFSHCMVTLRETVPIFVARQRIRHTVGFTYNEVSRRYVDSEPEAYVPEIWRERAANLKQGSKETAVLNTKWCSEEYIAVLKRIWVFYEELLREGVCPEQARMVLPLSSYTSWYVTGSLAAWARAYNLRIEAHAQKEIQDLARLWGPIMAELFPVSWSALTQLPSGGGLVKPPT